MISKQIKRRIFTNFCLEVLLLGVLSCGYDPDSRGSNKVSSESATPNETTKNYLLSGVWIVKSLDVPDCKLCKENNIKLNEMMNCKVQTRDTLMFTKDSMLYKSINNQKISEKFKFKDTLLELVGSDWSYTMTVIKYAPDSFSLTISQRYVSDINNTEGAKYLIVQLAKLK